MVSALLKGNLSDRTLGTGLAADDYGLVWGATNKLRRMPPAAFANGVRSTDLVAAATTSIGAATGPIVKVTGNTGITSLGTAAAGVRKWVWFTGTPTLTHGSALVLPGAANFAVQANDILEFYADTADTWTCLSVYRAKRLQALDDIRGKNADIASASSVDLSTMTKDYADLTGNTGITAFTGLGVGAVRRLRYTGTGLTVTHNASTLICPGLQNLQLRTNDIITLVGIATNSVIISALEPASVRDCGMGLTIPADITGTWDFTVYAPYPFTLLSLVHEMSVGTITIAAVKINTTDVVGLTSLSATTTKTTTTGTATAVAAGDRVRIQTSGTPAASGALLTLAIIGRR